LEEKVNLLESVKREVEFFSDKYYKTNAELNKTELEKFSIISEMKYYKEKYDKIIDADNNLKKETEGIVTKSELERTNSITQANFYQQKYEALVKESSKNEAECKAVEAQNLNLQQEISQLRLLLEKLLAGDSEGNIGHSRSNLIYRISLDQIFH